MRAVQHRDTGAGAGYRDGAAGVRGVPHAAHVHAGRHQRAVLVLPHREPGDGGAPSGAHQLWRVRDDAHVRVRGAEREMCVVPVRDVDCDAEYARPPACAAKTSASQQHPCPPAVRAAVPPSDRRRGESHDHGRERQARQQCGRRRLH